MKHNKCRLQTEDRIPQKIKQNLESDWLNLAQLGLPLCQFPKAKGEIFSQGFPVTSCMATQLYRLLIFVIAKIDNGPE